MRSMRIFGGSKQGGWPRRWPKNDDFPYSLIQKWENTKKLIVAYKNVLWIWNLAKRSVYTNIFIIFLNFSILVIFGHVTSDLVFSPIR